jgi:MFS family permease
MLPPIFLAERRGKMKAMFLASVAAMVFVQLGFFAWMDTFWALVALLLAFFAVFNVLEATLPSLISRTAPVNARGTAIGVYNTTQSLGLFVGGLAGGWLAQHVKPSAVFVFGAALIALWLVGAAGMRVPGELQTRPFPLRVREDPARLRERLVRLRGVREAVVLPEQGVALLTFYADNWDEQAALDIIGGRV